MYPQVKRSRVPIKGGLGLLSTQFLFLTKHTHLIFSSFHLRGGPDLERSWGDGEWGEGGELELRISFNSWEIHLVLPKSVPPSV